MNKYIKIKVSKTSLPREIWNQEIFVNINCIQYVSCLQPKDSNHDSDWFVIKLKDGTLLTCNEDYYNIVMKAINV